MASSAHTLYVKRLYRRSLKLAKDWYWQNAEFRDKVLLANTGRADKGNV